MIENKCKINAKYQQNIFVLNPNHQSPPQLKNLQSCKSPLQSCLNMSEVGTGNRVGSFPACYKKTEAHHE